MARAEGAALGGVTQCLTRNPGYDVVAVSPQSREFLPAILGYDFNETMITDESTLSDFSELCETREEFDAWERRVLQQIEERYGVLPRDSGIYLVDLFRDIELHRRATSRQ